MPRRPRLAAGDFAYHVLNRRVGRLPLFEKPADYAALEKILTEFKRGRESLFGRAWLHHRQRLRSGPLRILCALLECCAMSNLSRTALQRRPLCTHSQQVEWREGVSPPRPPRTGREPLDSSGSYRPTGHTKGLALSMRVLLVRVARPITPDDAAPSVRSHDRTFLPTMSDSVPVPRLGTQALAGAARLRVSLCIGATGSYVPPPCLNHDHAAFMPDASGAVNRSPSTCFAGQSLDPGFDAV